MSSNAKRKNTKPVAMVLTDHHDSDFFMETVRKFSGSGGAHVYRCGLEADPDVIYPHDGWLELFIISPVPLSPKEVIQQEDKYYAEERKEERELAKMDSKRAESLVVDEETAIIAYKDFGLCISAQDINRIAKKKGFTMPRGWWKEHAR